MRLWAHECFRVFGDRLSDTADADWLATSITDVCKQHFEVDLPVALQDFYEQQQQQQQLSAGGSDAVSVTSAATADSRGTLPASTAALGAAGNALLFADFGDGSSRSYAQVQSDGHVYHLLTHAADEYNVSGAGRRMSLVLFSSFREHVLRVCRVLRHSNGHGLLVGVGGVGRRSVGRLAAYVCGLQCVELHPGDSWRDVLKEAMLKACSHRVCVCVCLRLCSGLCACACTSLMPSPSQLLPADGSGGHGCGTAGV